MISTFSKKLIPLRRHLGDVNEKFTWIAFTPSDDRPTNQNLIGIILDYEEMFSSKEECFKFLRQYNVNILSTILDQVYL